MDITHPQIIAWLSTALFCLGAVIVIFGVLIILKPDFLLAWGDRLNRWISTDDFFSTLDKPRFTERRFYHFHRLAGLIITAGALYFLYRFSLIDNFAELIRKLPVIKNQILTEWLYQSLFYFLFVGNIIALVLGLIVLIRPSILKRLEARLNRWFASERVVKPLDETHDIPQTVLPGNIRLFGFLVLVGGCYIMAFTGGYL